MREDDAPGGSTPSQYGLPEGATDLQDLIEHREMDFALGNIFKACYRIGTETHSDEARDLRKIIWFAQRKLAQLEGVDLRPSRIKPELVEEMSELFREEFLKWHAEQSTKPVPSVECTYLGKPHGMKVQAAFWHTYYPSEGPPDTIVMQGDTYMRVDDE